MGVVICGTHFLSLLLIPILSNILLLTVSQGKYLHSHFCINTTDNSYPSSNRLYQRNLNETLLRNLSWNTDGNGFYIASVAKTFGRVYANCLCRIYVTPDRCRDCLTVSTNTLPPRCPNYTDAILYNDECTFRYSSKDITGIMLDGPEFSIWNSAINLTGADQFSKALGNLLESLRDQAAASGGSLGKFANGNSSGPDFVTIYALVQCTPDLSKNQCSNCLQGAFQTIFPGCKGGRTFRRNCYFRYELDCFFDCIDTGRDNVGRDIRKRNIVVISASLSIFFVLMLLSYYIYCKRRRGRTEKGKKENQGFHILQLAGTSGDDNQGENLIVGDLERTESTQDFPSIKFDIICSATNQVSNENKLGQGGFGPVYKGILPDGNAIAVKRLSKTSGQGREEFKNEITLIARLQHRNLVRLLGCCLEGNELLLIYEYMPNKSLDFFIFDSNNGVELDWTKRVIIVKGIARGILYLHEDSRLRIIHRDLKASNVLLDKEMNPKISDFGLARIFEMNQDEANTNRVVGTHGYMAPEYAMGGLFSVKSDIFGFGVLLLEIISGKRNTDFHVYERGHNLLSFAWKLWSEGRGLELLDHVMKKSSVEDQVSNYIHIGLSCVQDDPANRPTMSLVVVMLASDTVTLPQPTKPTIFPVGRQILISSDSSSGGGVVSLNEISCSTIGPR